MELKNTVEQGSVVLSGRVGSNKVAIVTGGGSGVGFAIAKKFIKNGITTIIAGRNEAKLKDTKEQLSELFNAIPCDVSNLASIPAFVEEVLKRFVKIDILVNNAGINMKKDFTEVSNEEFQGILTTNVTAVFAISREVVKHVLPRGSGNFIHISSMAAQ